MKAWIGFGSNLGDRRANLEKAAGLLLARAGTKNHVAAPIVQSAALVPAGAPAEWNQPFMNSVLGFDWPGSAAELLTVLKQIELELGRAPAERWAPRLIDLDLLVLGEQKINTDRLQVPHPEIKNRPFVLAPFKHLASSLRLTTEDRTVLQLAREHAQPLPLWMGIVNLTPDSFSEANPIREAQEKLERFATEGVHILDFGAESTRPGATPISASEEWKRLAPTLEWWMERMRHQIFRPCVSVDTYHAETAAHAVAMGADMINDVGGLASPEMLDVIRHSQCQYVLMHNLKVQQPLVELKAWAEKKLTLLQNAGIDLGRVIFDPGIGFGKTPAQSWELVKSIDHFLDLPVRILVGHSRKSFLKTLRESAAADREYETLGLSLRLASRGVDILRVHEPVATQRAYFAYTEGAR